MPVDSLRFDATQAEMPHTTVLVYLTKNVLYRDQEPVLWNTMMSEVNQIRQSLWAFNTELGIDDAYGFAWLKHRAEDPSDADGPRLSRFIKRQPLSVPVSLLLTLLRKRVVESDMSDGTGRVIVNRDDVVTMVQTFLGPTSNEVSAVSSWETHLGKLMGMGFLREVKGASVATYEIMPIIRAMVDMTWLSDFDDRIGALYREALAPNTGQEEVAAGEGSVTPESLAPVGASPADGDTTGGSE